MSIGFVGVGLDGHTRSPVNEDELSSLGCRVQLNGQPKGEELAHCIVVPAEWTLEDGRKAVMAKLSLGDRRS